MPESSVEPTDGSTDNAVTEIIPVVTDDEPPTVRGTARRSAAALPALGRKDGSPKVPRSSRSTLDRREKEQKAAAAATAPEAPAARPEPANPFAAPRPRSSPENPPPDQPWPADGPWPEVASAPGLDRPAEPSLLEEFAAALSAPTEAATPPPPPPAPAPTPPPGPPPPPPAPAPVPSGLTSAATEERSEEGRRHLEAPEPARAERAPIGTAPGPARAERAPMDTEVIVAQLAIDDTAEIDVAALPAPPGPAGGGRARREGGASPVRRPARAKRAPHNPDDRWDAEPPGKVANDAYQGRRRAPRALTRPAVLGTIVVLALGALVGVPMVLRSSTPPPGPTTIDPGTQPAVALPVPSPSDDGEISSTAGPVSSATPTRTSLRTATRTSPGSPVVNPTVEPTTPPPTTQTPFTPLTVEAEAGGNTVVSPAVTSNYGRGTSGGRIVGFLGVTSGQSGVGRLIFPNVSVPSAGVYTLTFHYIADGNRTAHIRVNGGTAVQVGTSRFTDCCGAGTLDVTLQAGTNSIEFTNPSARCPAIDRIVITRT